MPESLIVRVDGDRQNIASASWMVVDDAGSPLTPVRSGVLSEAAPLAAGRRVLALVPAVDVLFAEPQLPVRGGARLAQVVPFAMEEQLAQDLEDMHFAVGRRVGERPGTPVAAVARVRMDQWLAALHDAQLRPHALYPDGALLPANPSQTVLLIEQQRLFVRHPQQQPVVLDVEPLATALSLAGLELEPETRHVIVYLNESDWQRHQGMLEVARERFASLQVQLLADGALPLLARTAVAEPTFNLLQGAYAPRTQFGQQWRRWRVAATLLLCLLGLNLAGKGVELWRLKQTEVSLDAAIEETFQRAMPGEQNAVNARRRMESRLAAVRSSSISGGGILQMLSAVGSAFVQVPEAKLGAFSFRNNVLDLKVDARDTGSLSRLESLVGQGGLSAQLQSSSSNGSGVEGRVQVMASAP